MVTKGLIGSLLLLALAAASAWSFAGVCGDATGVRAFRADGVDGSQVPSGCYVIPEAQTAAQVTLWEGQDDKRFLRVIAGLLDLKPQTEIDAILAADAQAAQAATALETELNTPGCNPPSPDALEQTLTGRFPAGITGEQLREKTLQTFIQVGRCVASLRKTR